MIFINIRANPTLAKSVKETEVHIFHSMLTSEDDVVDEASSTKAPSKMKFPLEHFLSKQHCLKVSKYGVFSGPYFPAFGLNTERYFVSPRFQSECDLSVFSPNAGKYGPETTSYLDTFHTV